MGRPVMTSWGDPVGLPWPCMQTAARSHEQAKGQQPSCHRRCPGHTAGAAAHLRLVCRSLVSPSPRESFCVPVTGWGYRLDRGVGSAGGMADNRLEPRAAAREAREPAAAALGAREPAAGLVRPGGGTILAAIGNTPLTMVDGVRVKLEYPNPP